MQLEHIGDAADRLDPGRALAAAIRIDRATSSASIVRSPSRSPRREAAKKAAAISSPLPFSIGKRGRSLRMLVRARAASWRQAAGWESGYWHPARSLNLDHSADRLSVPVTTRPEMKGDRR
jgi:hypothetical protein